MKKNGTVRPSTNGQVVELFSSITSAILSFVQNINFEQAKWLIGHKKQLAKAIRDAILSLVGSVGDLSLAWWWNFYQEEGIEIDFSSFQIPKKPEGDWWLVIVAPGVTYNKVIQNMCKKFKVRFCADNDLDLRTEQRRAVNKPYAVWVKANVEADPELGNKSADDLEAMPVINLLERLLLEIYFFSFVSNGNHLDDITSITLCAGSRGCTGGVPGVDCTDDIVAISWYRPNRADVNLRSRRVVSFF